MERNLVYHKLIVILGDLPEQSAHSSLKAMFCLFSFYFLVNEVISIEYFDGMETFYGKLNLK